MAALTVVLLILVVPFVAFVAFDVRVLVGVRVQLARLRGCCRRQLADFACPHAQRLDQSCRRGAIAHV